MVIFARCDILLLFYKLRALSNKQPSGTNCANTENNFASREKYRHSRKPAWLPLPWRLLCDDVKKFSPLSSFVFTMVFVLILKWYINDLFYPPAWCLCEFTSVKSPWILNKAALWVFTEVRKTFLTLLSLGFFLILKAYKIY